MDRVEYPLRDATTASALDRVRAWFREQLFVQRNEAICPCCTRVATLYDRTFDRSKAYALMVFASKLEVGAWALDPAFLKSIDPKIVRAREWSRLQLWGLIEKQGKKEADEDEAEGARAVYRLTPEGLAVAQGKPVPQTLFLFAGVVRQKSTEQVTVKDVLGVKDYRRLSVKLPKAARVIKRDATGTYAE